MLRKIWVAVAFVLVGLLVVKFALVGMLGKPLVLPLLGLAGCLYLLFMLEGLQVAGLKIKDLDPDGIEHFLAGNPASERKVLPVYKTFSGNFDGFVTGRQVFVIMTVVTLAFLFKEKLVLCGAATGGGNEPGFLGLDWFKSLLVKGDCPVNAGLVEQALGLKSSTAESVFGFLDSTAYAFASATLIPAWISQLLPQFMADKQAISFICTPGARGVLRLAMFLDEIKLGQPAHFLFRLLRQGGTTSEEHIPIGKSSYHEASLNYYGRAKKRHEISFDLGTPTRVQENIHYVFKRGSTESLEHFIQLAAPIKGEIKGSIDMPENVHMQVKARDAKEGGLYSYWLKFEFNRPLPGDDVEEDEVRLSLEYLTTAYTNETDALQLAEFYSYLPTEVATMSIRSSDRLLKKPKVGISEIEGIVSAVPDVEEVTVSTPQVAKNEAEICIKYPIVGTGYQIEFQTMAVALESQKREVTPESKRQLEGVGNGQ